jgi:ABC-type dipeptide/oligopeptide/nickel transport system ATPase component
LVLTAELFKKFLDEEISEDIKSIVELQTEGLQEIFYDKNMSACADISESRGKVSVSLQAVNKTKTLGEIQGDPTTSFGGSIATIQGILLRISVLYRRELRPVLILDETLKFVNKQYIERAVAFLQRLCEEMGLDILLITHDHDIVSAAKNAYRINYNDGTATFQRIK